MTAHCNKLITISERLDTLERQNHWLRFGLIAIASGVGVVLLTAAMSATTRQVTAQKFVLVDANGKIRAGLALGTSGEPEFYLSDAGGTRRLVLGSVVLTSQSLGGGGTEVTTAASITAFDGNGNVISQWPQ